MAEQIDIKEGYLNLLKKLIHKEAFIDLLFKLLLGKKEAANELKIMFLRASRDRGINEMVAANRIIKGQVNEEADINGKDKNLMRKIYQVWKKSYTFQTDVIVAALKKPGAVSALYRLIKSRGTDMAAWDIIANAVCEAAGEVAGEDEEMQVSLSENINTNENSVNIMVGRFQPFTLGHLKCLKAIKDSLGVPTLLCVIPGNGDSKHPFAGKVQDEMYERLSSANPDLIADVAYVKNAFIEPWVLAAKERGMEPVSWTCGTDRREAYENMVQKHGQNYGLSPDFRVYCLDRADDNISATNVRECLVNGDKEGFMRQMPECLWDMYDEMRNVMVGDTEPSYQSIMEGKAYDDYKKFLDKGLKELLK